MSKLRNIPLKSKEIQIGLWLNEYETIICGKTYTRRELYSSEGYCFYDKTRKHFNDEIEIADEEELKKVRIYMQYASLGLNADVSDFISVKIEEGFEIV